MTLRLPRPTRTLAATLALGIMLAASPSALADEVDPRMFDVALGAHALISLETNTTAGHLVPFAGLSTMYVNDEIAWQDASGPSHGPLMRRLISQLGAGIGILDWLEASLALPLHWSRVNLTFGTDHRVNKWMAEVSLGDLRLDAQATLLRRRDQTGLGIGVLAQVTLPSGDDNAFATDGGFTFTPGVVVDYRAANGALAVAQLAFRLRPTHDVALIAIGNELRYGVGGEYPLGHLGLFAALEVVGSLGFAESDVDPAGLDDRKTPVEVLAALRWRSTTTGVVVTGGFGSGVSQGYGASDHRAFLSVTYRHAPTDDPIEDGPATTPDAPLRAGDDGGGGTPTGTPPDTAGGGGGTPTGTPPDTAGGGGATAGDGKPPTDRPTDAGGVKAPPTPSTLDPAAFDAAAAADPDPDGDGIPGAHDRCPDRAEDRDGFEDSDGCPEPDNDKDGVPDADDRCPTEKETINGVDDDDGCPDQGRAKVKAGAKTIELTEKVMFKSGSDRLEEASESLLREVAAVLKAAPQVERVRIEGHTDDLGNKEFNIDLSERRARAVKAFLVGLGIPSKRLEAKGFGPLRPLESNKSPEGRSANRRVEFHLVEDREVER